MNEPDVAGAGDRDPHQSSPPASMCACSSSSGVHRRRRTRARRLPGRPCRCVTICALPKRVTAVSQNRPGRLSMRRACWPTAFGGICALDEADAARWGRSSRCATSSGQQPAQHLVGGPRDGRDRRDAEPLVDQRAARVVDAGDDVLDPVGLAGDAGAQDVGVVAAGHRGEGAGLVDARRGEVVAVEAEADDGACRRSRRAGGGTRGRSCRRPPRCGPPARARRRARCPPGRSR